MRLKDERKPEAITKTIIKLINNIGFANISMSKIAKETGLSPATLYIYYESKDDMLRKTYMSIKRQMSQECLSNINISDDIKDIVFQLCRNLLAYMETHADEFLFLEQSANSPLVTDDMIQQLEENNQDIIRAFRKGIEAGYLKNESPTLLLAFCYYPIQQIFKETRKEKTMLPGIDFNKVFQMCWDAIKA